MRNLEAVKWLAFLFMLVDHIPKAYGYDLPITGLLGRFAFPLFAYVWGSSQLKVRKFDWLLFFVAVLSQFPYAYVFDNGKLNILFLFVVSGAVSQLLFHRSLSFALLFLPLIPYIEYGYFGLLLCLASANLYHTGNTVLWRFCAFAVNLSYHWLFALAGWCGTYLIGLNWSVKRIRHIGLKLYFLHLSVLSCILYLIHS